MKPDGKASKFETQTEIAKLLKSQGPMSRASIESAIGRRCDTALRLMTESGCVEQYEDTNDMPPGRGIKFMTTFYAYVNDPAHEPKAGNYSENTVNWCIKVLRQMGYTVAKKQD